MRISRAGILMNPTGQMGWTTHYNTIQEFSVPHCPDRVAELSAGNVMLIFRDLHVAVTREGKAMSGQRFDLSPPELRRLTDEVATLREDLSGQLSMTAGVDLAETGDPAVLAAIESFDANWRDGRDRVIDNLRQTGDTLLAVLHNYLATEDGVSGQFGATGDLL